MRYEKCTERRGEEGGRVPGEGGRRVERLRATRAKRNPEGAEPKNDRCHDKIGSVLLAVTNGSGQTER